MFQHITTHIFLTVLMYIFIFLSMRIMGKREIGKLSVFDLTISIMIAEIAVFVIEDIERPVYDGIVPMATLVLIQVLVAQISLKNRKLRLLIDGKPSVLISDGKIHRGKCAGKDITLMICCCSCGDRTSTAPLMWSLPFWKPAASLPSSRRTRVRRHPTNRETAVLMLSIMNRATVVVTVPAASSCRSIKSGMKACRFRSLWTGRCRIPIWS